MINQISQQLGINLPKDLSPAARARLKLYWHGAIIVLLNALLSAVVLINQNKTLTWRDVLIVGGGQVALAVIDAVKKYVTASGDISMETLLNIAQAYLTKNVPSVALPAPVQAVEQAVTQMLQVPFANNAVSSQAAVQLQPAPSGFIDLVRSNNPAPVQPAAAPVADHPSMDGVVTVNTLPNIVAIPKGQ